MNSGQEIRAPMTTGESSHEPQVLGLPNISPLKKISEEHLIQEEEDLMSPTDEADMDEFHTSNEFRRYQIN